MNAKHDCFAVGNSRNGLRVKYYFDSVYCRTNQFQRSALSTGL